MEKHKTVYPEQSSIQGEMEEKLDKMYDRIMQFGLIQIGFMVILSYLLLCGGCQKFTVRIVAPDGTVTTATHEQFMTDQKIGELTYDGGSFILTGYESEMQKALNIIGKLVASKDAYLGIEVGGKAVGQ